MSRFARRCGERLLLATHNSGKLAEFARLLAPLRVQLVSVKELGLPEPLESGHSYAENAVLKAKAAAAASGLAALADDSGLEVVGLEGQPGLHSADWAGSEKDFAAACRKVRDRLVQRFGGFAAADRRAAFVCVLALALPTGEVHLFKGRIEGSIVWPPRGDYGFGYDPIFVPEGAERTFAEMSPAEKDRFSHRGRAVAALRAAWDDPSA